MDPMTTQPPAEPGRTPQTRWEEWFQQVWAVREDVEYPRLFGPLDGRVELLKAAQFEMMGFPDPDARWLHHGVLTSPPHQGRPGVWAHVTTALSNPWGDDPRDADPRLPSGLGFEIALMTPMAPGNRDSPSAPAPWAVGVLHWLMAMQVLAASGRVQGGTLQMGDLVRLHRPIDGEDGRSALRNLAMLPMPGGQGAGKFALPSGTVDVLLAVGITDAEYEMALSAGGNALWDRLKLARAWPVTDARRGDLAVG